MSAPSTSTSAAPPMEADDTSVERTSGAPAPGTGATGGGEPPLGQRIAGWLRRPFDDPNPILLKELRATFRTALFIRFLYLTTGIVALLVLTWGAVNAGERAPAEVGQEVFHVFFSLLSVVLSMVAPAYAATTITGEKRAGTFESLLLSGMSPARIVWGKFAASYAAVVLCVIAAAPVVGLAFLFGGISPLAVAAGFGYVLLALAPGVAFGVAVSARIESLWLAIVISFFTYVGAHTFFVWPVVVALGDAAHSAWHTPFDGPFWFAEALPERIASWDGWAFLVLVPLYALGMPLWFFLATAIAGVRPAAEDRSTPLKLWCVPAIGGAGLIAACIAAAPTSVRDCGEAGVVLSILSGPFVMFVALLFANEPPLPPRAQSPSTWRRLFAPIGPGAGPTLRFAFLAVLASAAVVPGAVAAVRWARDPSYAEHLRYDAALFALAVGHAAVGLFTAAIAAWLRLVLRNGLAARVLTLAALAAAVLLPFLVTLVIDDGSISRLDRQVPPLLMLTPVLPTILAVAIGLERDMSPWEALRVGVPAVGYGLLAIAAWIAVEARGVRARRAVAERKARWAARAEHERAAAMTSAARPDVRPDEARLAASASASPPPDEGAVAASGSAHRPPDEEPS